MQKRSQVRHAQPVPLISYFRALLLIYTTLIFGEIVSIPLTKGTLPEAVRKFTEDDVVLSDERAALLGLLALTTLCLMLMSLVGLAFLWRPARTLYTVYLLFIAVGVVLSGTVVESSLTTVLSFMNTIISGLILGMIYFSPLQRYFEKPETAEGETGR